MDNVKITKILLEKDGVEYVAVPVSDELLKVNEQNLKAAGLDLNCNCGAEWCDGRWLWRCMYSGAGQCSWYQTYIVCP